MTPPDPLAPPPATEDDWSRFRAGWRSLFDPRDLERLEAQKRRQAVRARCYAEGGPFVAGGSMRELEGMVDGQAQARQEAAPQAVEARVAAVSAESLLPALLPAVEAALMPKVAAVALAVALKAQRGSPR